MNATLHEVGLLHRQISQAPIDHIDWLPPQLAFLKTTDRRVLLRCGNQVYGKTTVGLADIVWRALGRHPCKPVPPPPVELWVITGTWQQSIAIQTKLWELLPKSALHESTLFDPVRGFRGQHPVCRFANGSLVRIRTAKQGGIALSSATIHHALFDEPPPGSRVFAEVLKRVMHHRGSVSMTMTPVNNPVDWIREEAEAGRITDLHFPLHPDYLILPSTGRPIQLPDGTVCDQAWCDELRESGMPHEVPVTVDGEWEMRATEQAIPGFRPDLHVIPSLLTSDVAPRGEVKLAVGIDYGEDRLRTCSVLVYVDDSGEHPRVYVVGEYAPDTPTTLDMDAAAVVAMLQRTGDSWHSLDSAYGDKRYTDRAGKVTKKSNTYMQRAIANTMGVRDQLRPKLLGVKRGAHAGPGAVWRGVRWINDSMIRPGHFYVDASCTWLVDSLQRWDGRRDSQHKDIIDALRYALRDWIIPRQRFVPTTHRRTF